MKYDVLVLGSGPGGYVAAVRAAQLGMKTAIVERENLGGVCLNWGCIPTKALLQSAHVCQAVTSAQLYGVDVFNVEANMPRIVARSREVAATMSKGVQFLLNKAKVDIIEGTGKLISPNNVEVTPAEGAPTRIQADKIIIATGARSRQLPTLPIDGEKIIGYREALVQQTVPASLAIIGSGAIGCEFAEFYHSLGCQVTLIEALPNLLPLEDDDVSKAIGRAFRKAKIKTMTKAKVLQVETDRDVCLLHVETAKGIERIEAQKVLSAVGITPNTEGIGLEELGISTERGRIPVNEHYETAVAGVFAIGDVIATPALAHVASAEAVHCVEYIAGLNPHPVDYNVIPACTYTTPEVASVGLREREAKERGVEYIVGSFPFTASGKATAMGQRDGFVKLLFAADTHATLGAHIVGASATEMIAELALAIRKGITAEELHATIHPHPTLSEAVMEAAAAALGVCVHL